MILKCDVKLTGVENMLIFRLIQLFQNGVKVNRYEHDLRYYV